jgi:hypothetical protein
MPERANEKQRDKDESWHSQPGAHRRVVSEYIHKNEQCELQRDADAERTAPASLQAWQAEARHKQGACCCS